MLGLSSGEEDSDYNREEAEPAVAGKHPDNEDDKQAVGLLGGEQPGEVPAADSRAPPAGVAVVVETRVDTSRPGRGRSLEALPVTAHHGDKSLSFCEPDHPPVQWCHAD